jgi:putative transposase
MTIHPNSYYHLYNRTNNSEILFRTRGNYGLFIKKYRLHLEKYCETLAYCLMPTHFHFFIRITTDDTQAFKNRYSTMLSSYVQAFNNMHKRHGSLFQKRSKAKLVDDHRYAAALTAYIHNNPMRSGLVERSEEWEFSSYQDYCEMRNGTLVQKDVILSAFGSVAEFRTFSESTVRVEERFWV